MEELPVEDPAHMATAERQLHDWENFVRGKKLTDETSGEDVCLHLTTVLSISEETNTA